MLLFVPAAALPRPYALSVALAALLAWSIGSWKLAGRQFVRPVLHLSDRRIPVQRRSRPAGSHRQQRPGIMSGAFSESVVRQTLMLSFAGLAGLHLGALLAISLGSGSDRSAALGVGGPRDLGPPHRLGPAAHRDAGGGHLADDRRSRSCRRPAMRRSTTASSAAGIAATPFVLSGLLVPAALFLTASGARHAFDRRLATAVIVLFAVIQFYIGYRSTAAMPLIAWMWLHHKLDEADPLVLDPPVVAVLVFVVFPLVRETRNMSLG